MLKVTSDDLTTVSEKVQEAISDLLYSESRGDYEEPLKKLIEVQAKLHFFAGMQKALEYEKGGS